MTLSIAIREQVRRRANFACEFCGITETDAGSQLTIDHYQPKAKDGDDSLDNLIYCCASCNQHKLDYWDLTQFTERLLSQQSTVIHEQQQLLEALWKLLLFLGSKK